MNRGPSILWRMALFVVFAVAADDHRYRIADLVLRHHLAQGAHAVDGALIDRYDDIPGTDAHAAGCCIIEDPLDIDPLVGAELFAFDDRDRRRPHVDPQHRATVLVAVLVLSGRQGHGQEEQTGNGHTHEGGSYA